MKNILYSQEPTLSRMLIRFALVLGLLLVSMQLAVLLRLSPVNKFALVALASLPAIGLLVIEGLLARATRLRKVREEQSEQVANLQAMQAQFLAAVEAATERTAQATVSAQHISDTMGQAIDHAVAETVTQVVTPPLVQAVTEAVTKAVSTALRSEAFNEKSSSKVASVDDFVSEVRKLLQEGLATEKYFDALRANIRGPLAKETTEDSGLSKEATSRMVALVQGSPLFMGLSPADCREIVSAAHEKHFARRQTIFLEGDPARRVVLLTSGSAKIVQLGQSGAEVILGVRGPGEVVGTLGLLPQDRRSSTALALAPSTALVWDAAAFETLSERSVRLRHNIAHIVRQRIDELEQRYREISTERIGMRLLHELVRLANQIGRRVNESTVEICLSRWELAQMTGTTLFTVSRLLSDWKERGIVSTRRETVQVHLSKLKKLEFEEKLEPEGKLKLEPVTRPRETVDDAPLPQKADSARAVLPAADLAGPIEDLKVKAK